jgi:hypothetical protein
MGVEAVPREEVGVIPDQDQVVVVASAPYKLAWKTRLISQPIVDAGPYMINNGTIYAIKTGGLVWIDATQSWSVSIYQPIDRQRLDEKMSCFIPG